MASANLRLLAMALIDFQNVTKRYKTGEQVLTDINISIAQGEFVSLVGASGVGKSTLLKLIYAEEKATEGAVFFDGRDLSLIKRRVLPHYRRNFGTVFQDAKLLENKTIYENVAYTLEIHGKSTAQIREEVPRILDVVGLSGKMDKYPGEVSGGEAQRASLARAVIHRPRVLVADEPTGNLDPEATWNIVNLLLKVNEFGTTVILATHDTQIVDQIHRRVIVLKDGRVTFDQNSATYTQTTHL